MSDTDATPAPMDVDTAATTPATPDKPVRLVQVFCQDDVCPAAEDGESTQQDTQQDTTPDTAPKDTEVVRCAACQAGRWKDCERDRLLPAVPHHLLMKCGTLKNMLEDVGEDAYEDCPVPVFNVTKACMEKVLEYLRYHDENPYTDEERRNKDLNKLNAWDLEYVPKEDAPLVELTLAANYLAIEDLLHFCCQYLAKIFDEVSQQPDGNAILRKRFNLPDDLTPEQKEEIEIQNKYLEEAIKNQ